LVSAIVPAYNEAGRIGQVLHILSQVKRLSEIIVVDDGSQDGTAMVARKAAEADGRIRVILHPENRGKGEAILSGWRTSRSTCLLLLDADLIGLTPQHIEELIQPVISGQAEMTQGLFSGGWWFTDYSHRLTPWLTGQRCLRARLLRELPAQAAAGYGFETALSLVARRRGWRCQPVALTGVSHLPSEVHRGFWKGVRNRAKMWKQIIHAWYLTSAWQRVVARIRLWDRQG
jgi:glycosyltransferase involved in cell wall biosynthesis